MRTLVIPDIHHRIRRVDQIINRVEHDNIVFLGDYQDDFGDTMRDVEATAHWLKNSLEQPNRVHLWGNHDFGYAYNYDVYQCPGNTPEKRKKIRKIIPVEYWKKIKLAHEEQGWWFSHAGLHQRYFEDPVRGFSSGFTIGFLEAVMYMAESGQSHDLLLAGPDRGGHGAYGGILWGDWHSFVPIEGVKQVFGHTPDYVVRSNRSNYCIDTNSNHYALIEDENLSIYRYDQ